MIAFRRRELLHLPRHEKTWSICSSHKKEEQSINAKVNTSEMKPNRLVQLTTSAAVLLLLPSEVVNAFQLPQRISLRKLAAPSTFPTITVDAPSYISRENLPSKSTIFTKPSFITKLLATKQRKKKNKKKQLTIIDTPNTKQILSIVTTCLFTCLIRRPRIANAAFFLLDPTTLTYDVPGIEIPKIVTFNNNVGVFLSRWKNSPPAAYWLWTSSLAIATAALIGTVIYGGLVHWLSFLDNYEVGTFDNYNDEDMLYAYDDDEDEGKTKHVDWNVYSHVLLDGREEKRYTVHNDVKKIGKSE